MKRTDDYNDDELVDGAKIETTNPAAANEDAAAKEAVGEPAKQSIFSKLPFKVPFFGGEASGGKKKDD